MADRSNHYERAFEAYLRSLRVSCIPVDETRRAFADDESMKSLDFIIMSRHSRPLLVDVKGRKLSKPTSTRQNWATADDIRSLGFWRERFGSQSTALLVFLYWCEFEELDGAFTDHFEFEDRRYGCDAVELSMYRERMKVRSPRWQTVHLHKGDFDAVRWPISHWLHGEAADLDLRARETDRHPTSIPQ